MSFKAERQSDGTFAVLREDGTIKSKHDSLAKAERSIAYIKKYGEDRKLKMPRGMVGGQ